MKLKIDIDTHSGFCYGVVRAIEQAEKYLEKNSQLLQAKASEFPQPQEKNNEKD